MSGSELVPIFLLIIAAELGLILVIMGILAYELLKPKPMSELPMPMLVPLPGTGRGKPDDAGEEKPKQPSGQYI